MFPTTKDMEIVEIATACLVGVLSIVAVVLHFIFLQVLFKMGRQGFSAAFLCQKTFQRKKEWSITGIFLLTSCIAQIFYILLVAPGEIMFLITQEWKFGVLSCKLFKSMKDVTSATAIMAMLLMTADRLFGMTNPLKRNTYNKSRKYRRFMIALMVITPFSFGFPRFMSANLVEHGGDSFGRRWCVSKSVIAEWNSTEGTISDLLIALALCMYVLPVAVELILCVCLRLTSTRCKKKKKISKDKNRSSRKFVSPGIIGSHKSNVFGTPRGEPEVDSRKGGKKPKHLRLQEAIVKYAYLDTIIYACLWGPWYLTMLIVIRIERSSAEKVYIGTDVNHQKRIMHCFIYLSLSFVYIYFVVWPLRCVRMSNPAKWKSPQRDYSMIIKSERTAELPRRERRNAHVEAGLSRTCVLTNTTNLASSESLNLAEENGTIANISLSRNMLAVS